jgi:hypothetical protein
MATGAADTGRPGRADNESASRPQDGQELEALRFGWGDAYLIDFDVERGYWAARRDRIGGLLTAANPDELRQAITEDYAVRPVAREHASRRGRDAAKPVLGADPGALLTGSGEL